MNLGWRMTMQTGLKFMMAIQSTAQNCKIEKQLESFISMKKMLSLIEEKID